jgi:hypothetical protein
MSDLKIQFDEVTEPKLNVIDAATSGLNIAGGKPRVNFGPGADLLMNPSAMKKANSPKTDIALGDLTQLNSMDINSGKSSMKDARKSLFSIAGISAPKVEQSSNIKLAPDPTIMGDTNHIFDKKLNEDPILPNASEANAKMESNDGFKQFNEIPVNPEVNASSEKPLTHKEMLRVKFKLLRQLEALEEKGFKLSKKYSMDSSLEEMKGEYELIKNDIEKKSSVKFQGKMLMACVSGLEFLNQKFDPFDIKLDGWAESVNENIDEYDDVFGELHQKYAGKAKIAPELKLLFMLGGSAVMLHMTNTMFKSAMPGMDDIMRQNPELMQQFTQAAVHSMEGQNPGLGGFMRNMMPPEPPRGSPQGPPDNYRREPPKMNYRGGPRPDFAAGRGASFEDAENMENSFASPNRPPSPSKTKRVEMKGPADLSDILSGLKTKTINLKEEDKKSTVSISEIQELNETDFKKPKRSKRRNKSEGNSITLNI